MALRDFYLAVFRKINSWKQPPSSALAAFKIQKYLVDTASRSCKRHIELSISFIFAVKHCQNEYANLSKAHFPIGYRVIFTNVEISQYRALFRRQYRKTHAHSVGRALFI